MKGLRIPQEGILGGVLRFVNTTEAEEPEGRFTTIASSGFSLFSQSVSGYQRSGAWALSLRMLPGSASWNETLAIY